MHRNVWPFGTIRALTLAVGGLCAGWLGLAGHTTLLRACDFRIDEPGEVEVMVFNGTYAESVDSIPAESVQRLLHLGPDGLRELDRGAWVRGEVGSRVWRAYHRARGAVGLMDRRRTSRLSVDMAAPGTHVVAVEFFEARTAMTPEVFKAYLAEEGMDAEPVAAAAVDRSAILRERYTKTSKALFVVGEGGDAPALSTRPVGMVAEIVPLQDPAGVAPGGVVDLQLLLRGEPLPDQPVVAGMGEGFPLRPGTRVVLRSDANGQLRLPVPRAGVWWVSFDHVAPAPEGDEVDFVSHWTTLTFEIR